MKMRMTTRAMALLATALILPACDVRFAWDGFPTTSISAVLLGGGQVVPAVATAATGSASLTVNGHGTAVDYSVSETGIGSVTAVRIHVGTPGSNGPAIFTLATGAFTSPLTGTLTSSDLTPAPAQGISSFADAVAALKSGGTYLVICSAANPLGEIRSQIGAAALACAKLSGAQMVAPVAGTGSGSASVQLDDSQTRISVTLNVTALSSATSGAHLHAAKAGTNDTAIFSLAPAAFGNSLSVTLAAADFTANGTVATFDEAVNALLGGLVYVVVDTTGNPTGEIRGQIGPVQLSSALTGGAVVFPVSSSTNVGTATLSFDGLQTAVHVLLNHNVGAATGVLLHSEAVGVNGPQIFDVATASGGSISPVAATLTSSELIPQATYAIYGFPDAVDALIVGRTYIDVSSSTFPAGEIRGQIAP